MNDPAAEILTQDIVIDEVFPHAPSVIWQALASGELINRWLMPQTGFEPKLGCSFSFQTPPTDDWDGVIRCQIVEIIPGERLAFSWKSGTETKAGYAPRLDTVVTWTLAIHDGGTRLRLVHSGFVLPRNETVFKNVNAGWSKIIPRMIAIAAEQAQR